MDKTGKIDKEKKYGKFNEGCYHVGGGIINKHNSALGLKPEILAAKPRFALALRFLHKIVMYHFNRQEK